MNVESTTQSTKLSSTSSTTSSSSSNATSTSKTFKDELETVKTQDAKPEDGSIKNEDANIGKEDNTTKIAQQNSAKNLSQQVEKNKLKDSKDENNLITDPLQDLNSKIAALNNIKNITDSKIQEVGVRAEDSKDKTDYCKIIKMDNQDITFFVNLVENKQMTAQNFQGINLNGNQSFTDIKAEATQATVQVSATLLDALNEAAKTNKPFRIDFGDDVAVVMKVDKQGVLSANFIPGSAAVENYLRNNIASLRQSFDEQNLPYRELSYSNQQKQEQKNNQSQKDKEKENE